MNAEPQLLIISPPAAPDRQVAARIDAIWRDEQQKRPQGLFDGRILSLARMDGDRLICQSRPYRDFLAQQREPELAAILKVRPVAVAGLLECAEGLVFGRRGRDVTESAGKWELVPSGGVDGGLIEQGGSRLLHRQLRIELEEEVGIRSAEIDRIAFIAAIRSSRSGVIDLGFHLFSHLSASDIIARHAQLAKKEYDRLEIVAASRLAEFLEEASEQVDDVSLALLRQVGRFIGQLGQRPFPRDLEVLASPVLRAKPKRAVVIVQARTSSTRLPAKVLKPLGSRTVLEQCLHRCRAIEGIDAVVCATTTDPADDRIAAIAQEAGVLVFRGSVTDVLGRYLGAARLAEADIILRVTSDCPLIDPGICAKVLRLREETRADYVSNNMPASYPHGLDCEAFTRVALELADEQASESYDREHVTPWIRRQPQLKQASLIGPGWPASAQRWTLDYPEDYTFFKAVFDATPEDQLQDMQSVLSVLARHREIEQINVAHSRAGVAAGRSALVFRFDADETIGTGHAMRCATVSRRFEELGWPCYWAVTRRTATFLGRRIQPGQLIILPDVASHDQRAEAELGAIAAQVADISLLAIDHYALPGDFAARARTLARQVMVFDDFADRPVEADIIVNATPGVSHASYSSLAPQSAKLLIGGMAAPLRQQFAARRGVALVQRQASVSGVNRVLISFGGVDPLDGTSLAIDAVQAVLPAGTVDVVLGANAPHFNRIRSMIAGLPQSPVKFRLLQDVAEMADLMMQADLCIGAPGTTSWERCCLGLPSLLVGIAENQRKNAEILVTRGAARGCGFLTTESRAAVLDRLAGELQGLSRDSAALQRMSKNAGEICDGRGVDRIVVNCLPPVPIGEGVSLLVRTVEAADEALLLAWRQAPESRRFGFDQQSPIGDEHHRWLDGKLHSVGDFLLIGEVGDGPVSYLQAERRGDNRGSPIYLCRLVVAPGQSGRVDCASAMLKAVRSLIPGGSLLIPAGAGDTASMNMLQGLGYELRPDGYWWSLPQT
ncbi:MAG TPA: UDP-2,4-diacetamido-2,4,6-trideoxy-beta-L-altropyranose hydrolase [Terriglobia bacterium]|nr:UDP-2,4-diacetamido-2,4,6-trideoxy-beta-L-altropyranose hydrolase [Terriglobia bacterium]